MRPNLRPIHSRSEFYGPDQKRPGASADFKTPRPQPLPVLVAQFEASLIKDALRRCGGNQVKAALLLGVAPNTLHYKIKRLGLQNQVLLAFAGQAKGKT